MSSNNYKIWAQNVLPIVFDDYLQQKDLIIKLVQYVNGLVGDAVTLNNDFESLDSGTIGDLEDLHTTEKDSIVGAINEVEDDVEDLKTGKLDAPEIAGTSGQVLVSDGEGGQVWGSIGSGEIVVDDTLTVSGAAADAKKTGDEITSVKADITNTQAMTAPAFSTATNYTKGQYVTYEDALYRLTQNHAAGAWNSAHVESVDVADVLEDFEERKADVDGSYDDMTVGNAKQLVSTVGIEDKVPYNFRTSGGSADIGDRETEKVVGGTVAWNQIVDTVYTRGTPPLKNVYWVNPNNQPHFRFYTQSGEVTSDSDFKILKTWSDYPKNHKWLLLAKGNSSAWIRLYNTTAGGATTKKRWLYICHAEQLVKPCLHSRTMGK